ncbi:uncharacterized protein KY384_001347 [Bacidia gigantensis]|uniref:uncharacterized protein n=1 Tax=Bacidia gigantensis TaxID=2732470 RepID=UPI001D03C79E|nr:uncharacterized protein KY384_001347 [Bacidia gigantensis]KAG8533607.1 hypothetical protein KY384_001347 [Bacidia gigantensis]
MSFQMYNSFVPQSQAVVHCSADDPMIIERPGLWSDHRAQNAFSDDLAFGQTPLYIAPTSFNNGQAPNTSIILPERGSFSSTPTEADWDRLKSLIIELYSKHTLDEVRDIMRDTYGLRASVKMYKDRRRKWAMDKNIKKHEMECIIRKQTARAAVGKRSVFYLRNTKVPEGKIARARKAFGNLSAEGFSNSKLSTPPGLTCTTPVISPLSTPAIIETPERILKAIETYIHGSFDARTWVTTEDGECTGKEGTSEHYDFYSECIEALRFLEDNDSSRTWQFLNMAMARVERMFEVEIPQMLGLITSVLLQYVEDETTSKIAYSILYFISAMSDKKLGSNHPITFCFTRLGRMQASQVMQTLRISQSCQTDCLTQRADRFNMVTLDLLIAQWEWIKKDNIIQTIEEYLKAAENTIGTVDNRTLYIRQALVGYYIEAREYKKAVKVAEELISCAAKTQVPFDMTEALKVLSIAHFGSSERNLAEQNLRRAISIGSDAWGLGKSDVIGYMSRLQSWLRRWDRHDEAAELQEEIDRIVEVKHRRLVMEEDEKWQRWQMSQAASSGAE